MKSVSLLTLSTVSSCRPLARVTPPPPSTAPGTSAPTSWAITPTWRRGGYSGKRFTLQQTHLRCLQCGPLLRAECGEVVLCVVELDDVGPPQVPQLGPGVQRGDGSLQPHVGRAQEAASHLQVSTSQH